MLAIDGREVRAGGPMEVRLVFAGGNIDFRPDADGVPALVELLDEADEPSCLVGDLLGDFLAVSTAQSKSCEQPRVTDC